MKIIINSDAFNIAQRLKKIDKKYVIKFDKKMHRFEVYYKTGLNEKLELTLPFEELDYRTIERIFETRIENLQKLIEQMDAENEKLEKAELNQNLEFAQELVKKYAKLL